MVTSQHSRTAAVRRRLGALLLTGVACAAGPDRHDALRVAVAGNFVPAFAAVAEAFTAETGIAVEASPGSTGQLYAQIRHGAPFDVFLAADTVRPAALVRDGLADAASRFTYAVGRLVLFSRGGDLADLGTALERPGRWRLAIANPATAPYGAAARQVLERLGAWDREFPVIVRGENVGQAYQFVASGAAEAGLVARSYVVAEPPARALAVPDSLHDPIRQDAVSLVQGERGARVARFLAHLRSEPVRRLLEARGYGVP